MNKKLCFVLMPFGKKPDSNGFMINFDSVYKDLIYPAIVDANLEPIRADEEIAGGIIHKPMFERLILCEFAIADLTTANANVFYELGVRHATKNHTTIPIFYKKSRLPFDVGLIRCIPYDLNKNGTPVKKHDAKKHITNLLLEMSGNPMDDSPIYQLLDDYPDIDHTKTDVFRERVNYSEERKRELAKARNNGLESIKEIEESLGDINNIEAGVIIDLFLSYRSAKSWDNMIRLTDEMPKYISSTVLVQEQLAFALNRAGKSETAEKILLKLITEKGPSSETYGILGRVYKDRWQKAVNDGKTAQAKGFLNKAIETYLKGFESDWRDAYPGVNALTLMELKEPPDPRRIELNPIVSYAVKRKIETGTPDYWDYATMLELAVLGNDIEKAQNYLADSMANIREVWEPETTANNLNHIIKTRDNRGEDFEWIKEIKDELIKNS